MAKTLDDIHKALVIMNDQNAQNAAVIHADLQAILKELKLKPQIENGNDLTVGLDGDGKITATVHFTL